MLIGRERELGRLAELLTGGVPGGVLGGAGIGKTSLLHAAADARGAGVADGGALAALGHVPYLPLLRALRRDPPDGDPAFVVAWVRREVGARTLVLDDLHWADRATLSLLPLLANRVALLVGIRSGDPGTAGALAYAREAGVAVVDLAGLADEDAATLVRRRRPKMLPEDVDLVVERAGGNPLLLEELGAGGAPSTTLRLSLRARLARCSPDSRDAMALLGLLGRPAGLDLLPGGARELLDAALVEEVDGALRPRHPLLGEEAAADLVPAERAALHLRLAASIPDRGEAARHYAAGGNLPAARASALEAASSATREGERAAHLALAAGCSEGEEADRLRLDAAEALLGVGDPAVAEELLAAAERRDGRWALLAGQAAFGLGEHERARSLYADGLAGPVELDLRVRLRLHASHLSHFAAPDPAVADEARALLRMAQAAGVEETRARWLYGAALYWMKGSPTSLSHLRPALESARRAGDFELEGNVATSLFGALQGFGRPEEARRIARETAARARRRRLRKWEYTMRWAGVRLELFCFGDAEGSVPELTRIVGELALPREHLEQATADLSVALALAGRYDDARDRIASITVQSSPWARTILDWADAEVSWLAGNPQRTLDAAKRVLADHDARLHLYARGAAAWAEYELGRPIDDRVPGLSPSDDSYAPLQLEVRALVDLTQERYGDAEAGFRKAAVGWRRRVLYLELRARWAAAICAVRAGDLRRGRAQLLELERRTVEAGLVPLRTRVERALREAGVQRRAPRVRAEGLSAREREVLQLVGAGHTTASIARRLGLAPSTVDRTVRTAVWRLGARNRVQAAAMAGAEVEGN